jgi:hypothetical protein
MNLQQLNHVLEANGDSSLHFLLPSGETVPQHFHVTEVGRIDKHFVDCGGTRRSSAACVLQVWADNDTDHRLTARKLAKIIKLAEPILDSQELPVEVEYGRDTAVQYRLSKVEITSSELRFILTGKQTACLANDQCGLEIISNAGCC